MTSSTFDENHQSATQSHHLVHRPRTWDPQGLLLPEQPGEEFVLTGPLPPSHPVLGDGPATFHDIQAAAEALREAGEFIGHYHFGIPADHTALFYRCALDTSDIAPWRVTPGPSQLTASMTVTPDRVIDTTPRALRLDTKVDIDGAPCGTVSAELLFLAPLLHRSPAAHNRRGGSGGPARSVPVGASTPVAPAEVGRADPSHVLLRNPSTASHGRLTVDVALSEDRRQPAGAGPHVPALTLFETVRQTSLLTAGRSWKPAPHRVMLTSLHMHYRGYAEADRDMRCAAVPGTPSHDGQGRRTAPVTLTLTQSGRTVLEAVTIVTEDF